MKKHRPKVEKVPSTATEAGAKSVAEKPGTRPSTVGPSTMPASISATTPGWRKGRSRKAKRRDRHTMSMTCTRKSAKASGSALPVVRSVESEPAARAAVEFDAVEFENMGESMVARRRRRKGPALWLAS